MVSGTHGTVGHRQTKGEEREGVVRVPQLVSRGFGECHDSPSHPFTFPLGVGERLSASSGEGEERGRGRDIPGTAHQTTITRHYHKGELILA